MVEQGDGDSPVLLQRPRSQERPGTDAGVVSPGAWSTLVTPTRDGFTVCEAQESCPISQET
jgi:hypothetical protein